MSRGVRIAFVSNNTFVFEVHPGVLEGTTLASVVSVVAGDHVLWGENDVVATFDASSVGENFRGGESPAGTASGLVSDGVDTVGPLGSGVERSGESDEVSKDVGFNIGSLWNVNYTTLKWLRRGGLRGSFLIPCILVFLQRTCN